MEYATILAFDVKVTPEATEYAEQNGIKIFTANIIYHLFDQFTEYLEECRKKKKGDLGKKAVFPCVLEMVQDGAFRKQKPLLLGVNVKGGVARVGTPLCIPDKEKIRIGNITSIQHNGKDVNEGRANMGSITIKVEGEDQILFGRHFDQRHQIVS